jgi:hypothetical protein
MSTQENSVKEVLLGPILQYQSGDLSGAGHLLGTGGDQ